MYVERIQSFIDEGHFAGAALLASRFGRTVVEHYAGDARHGQAADASTLWPIASISKMFAVAAIMRLIEQGAMTLNTLASQVLPRFTGDGRELIRLRHLLTHTSGLIYESPEMEARLIAQTPLTALVDEAMHAPLQFAPGSSFAYADYNTLIAGEMAVVATGQPLQVLIARLVLQPMGLANTFFPPEPAAFGRIAQVRAVMAEDTPGAMYNSPYALSLTHPAFGVVASAPDLLRFIAHFMPGGPRIHTEATIQAMTRDQTGGVYGKHVSLAGLSPNATVPWGLGWALQTEHTPALFSDLASPRTFGHGGASGCQLLADPETGVCIALLTNTHLRAGREQWTRRLHAIINACYAECLGLSPP
jgi:CubicO group peptidase (beta-lactamase class C family)